MVQSGKRPVKKSYLEQFRNKAKLMGIDLDAVLKEINDAAANKIVPLVLEQSAKMLEDQLVKFEGKDSHQADRDFREPGKNR